MSNEELVADIQAGAVGRMGELWEQVAGLIKWKARQIMTALRACGRCCVELEDLCQTGYIALAAAVDTYKPGGCSFASWFMFYLQTEFAEATGSRTNRQHRDPLNKAISLLQPIGEGEDDGILADVIPDPNGELPIAAVEDQIWYEQLSNALSMALSRIPEGQQEVLRHRYYKNHTLTETANRMGISTEEVRKNERKGLQRLRGPGNIAVLRPFFEFDYYYGAGLGAFKNTGMSIQERYLIFEEEQKSKT